MALVAVGGDVVTLVAVGGGGCGGSMWLLVMVKW